MQSSAPQPVSTEQVTIDLTKPSQHLSHQSKRPATLVGAENHPLEFTFELCRKSLDLGSVSFQWWMSQKGLYGERNQESKNRQSIVDLYWSICLREGSAATDRGVQETYILASLLPHARSNGSRRVFADASLTRAKKIKEFDRQTALDNLEGMLKASKTQTINAVDFNLQTADVLGPPVYDGEVKEAYGRFVDEMLGESSGGLDEEGLPGLQRAIDKWRKAMRTIGRRSGNEKEKQVLDILSYECRAAFHRCYSATWLLLLDELATKRGFSEESMLFHRLWHLQQCQPSNEMTDRNFFLFHGHIFGLHPALGDFISTPTGRELIGELISAPSDDSCHQGFLYGVWIASFDYANRNDVAKELRKKSHDSWLDGSFETTERIQFDRESGRRPSGVRDTDAR